ncbi:MAG: type I-E CRISPR-associated protein Cse2/CasB [Omnitrophica bacterium GWA2_52_8]|nr:MAG: type I-E CRISPR-associated protein Cse2/CasB [Omnitrophica bacterium GWA2_52_8]
MKESLSFDAQSALGHALLRWWKWLENDRGGRAELRRAHDLTAVALTGAYQRFYQQMMKAGWPDNAQFWKNERLAAIAGLLAHVKSEDGRTLSLAMSEGDRPKVSELRFRRLLESPTLDDVFISLRRALPIIGHKANINQLANALLFWGDNVKKEWAYAYRWPEKSQAKN